MNASSMYTAFFSKLTGYLLLMQKFRLVLHSVVSYPGVAQIPGTRSQHYLNQHKAGIPVWKLGKIVSLEGLDLHTCRGVM